MTILFLWVALLVPINLVEQVYNLFKTSGMFWHKIQKNPSFPFLSFKMKYSKKYTKTYLNNWTCVYNQKLNISYCG